MRSSSPGSIGGSIFVSELIALSGDAYLNLLSYFGRHDIHAEISLRTGSDDRLAIVFADAERLTVRQNYAVLLRVCDFQAAMMARPAASEQEASELTLRVEDADAPWNDGAWRVGVAGGRTWAERTQTAVELALSARLLGPVFNGYLSPSAAVAAGLAARTSEEALRRADEVFRAERAPYFTDSF